MYAVLSPDTRLGEHIRDVLGRDVARYGSWPEFHRALDAASVAIVALNDLANGADHQELLRLAARSAVPVLLLTRLSRPNAAALAGLGLKLQVVWLDELVPELRNAVRNALSTAARGRLTASVECARLSPWLRRALLLALDQDPPLHSVRQWARLASCAVPTLEYHWRCEIQPCHHGFHPKDFLDLALLLRAAELLRQHKTAVTAQRLGVHRRTLERALVRAGFRSIGELRSTTPQQLAKRIASALPSHAAAAAPNHRH